MENLNADELYDYINNRKRIEGYTTISPSSLKTFLTCRLQYYFSYIKDWKIEVYSPNLSVGTAFHAAAESHNIETAMGKKVTKNDLFAEFEAAWDVESKMLAEEGYSQGQLDTQKLIGLDLVERFFLSRTRKNLRSPLYLPPMAKDQYMPAVELHLDMPLMNVSKGEVIRDDYHVTGFIDNLAISQNANSTFNAQDLVVIDYKTASRVWEEFTVQTNLQILMYSYAIRHLLRNTNQLSHLGKDKEDYAGIICLVKGAVYKNGNMKPSKIKNYFIKVDDEEISFLENMLTKVCDEIDRNETDINNWIPSPSPDNCRHCPYQTPCLAFRKGHSESELDAWWKKVRK